MVKNLYRKIPITFSQLVSSNSSTDDQIQVRIYQGLDVFISLDARLAETHKDTCRAGKLQSDTLLLMHIDDKNVKSLMVIHRLYKIYSYLLHHQL